MKNLIIVCLLFFLANAFAQSLPEISCQDYGYKKQVKKVEQIYYSFDGENVEKVEKLIRVFNADGNLESYENQSFLDESWAKSKTVYKNGRLHQEIWQHSNPYLNRTYTYEYDKENRIIKEKIRFKDGAKSYIDFQYQNKQLNLIDAEIDGVKSSTERHYSQNGNLYKEIHHQKVPGEADIITNYFYLEDREILSFVAPQSYFYATAYLKDAMDEIAMEIKFKLIEDSTAQSKILKGIQRFDAEVPKDNLPFDLQGYSEQTLQVYSKNPEELKPYRMLVFLRDEHKNIIAEAEVDIKTKKIAGIGFFQITYADGTVMGNTDFQHKKVYIFEAMLEKYQLP
ncbi:hypothetical protein [Chryseobacterium echinoideorum]|uniref:hypothetical protein n=1 Tax=Chryseobacterium echinoideorum TaxID=1549648 RepID=UPI0011857935|nr:hypothetical protein [Chryseobacterium echinoideorum]